MTELAEIQNSMNLLTQVITDLHYEINTNPGECDEVKDLMKYAKENAQKAMAFLSLAQKQMSE